MLRNAIAGMLSATRCIVEMKNILPTPSKIQTPRKIAAITIEINTLKEKAPSAEGAGSPRGLSAAGGGGARSVRARPAEKAPGASARSARSCRGGTPAEVSAATSGDLFTDRISKPPVGPVFQNRLVILLQIELFRQNRNTTAKTAKHLTMFVFSSQSVREKKLRRHFASGSCTKAIDESLADD